MTWNIKASELRVKSKERADLVDKMKGLNEVPTWELSDDHKASLDLEIDKITPVFKIWRVSSYDYPGGIGFSEVKVCLNNVEVVHLYRALKSLLGDAVDASDDANQD